MVNAYMCNPAAGTANGTVTVIDTSNDAILYPTTGVTVKNYPIGVAITPDGLKAFIVNSNVEIGGGGSVSVIDTARNEVIELISLSAYGPKPQGIAIATIANGNTYAYVTVTNADLSGYDVVVVIDTNTYAVVTYVTIPLTSSSPFGIAITPDGNYVYVACEGSNNISYPGIVAVIKTPSTYVGSFVLEPVSEQYPYAVGVAITNYAPYTAFVTLGGTTASSNRVAVFAANGVTSPVPSKTYVTVGNNPAGVAITPSGTTRYVYVANINDNTVSYFATTSTSSSIIYGLNKPTGLAITPDGSKVYVANAGNSTVSVISTASNTITNTITNTISYPGGESFGIFIQQVSGGGGSSFVSGITSNWFGC